jgi:tRNA pseudouridine38-40 synthase
LKLVVEYDGTRFSGWQQQSSRRTVEGELKRSLRELTGVEHRLQAAGRTDAGAHALGQVVNFDLAGRVTPERLVAGLNALLPEDVAVVCCEPVPADFRARRFARWRRYRYRYLDRFTRPALDRDYCWHIRGRLDEEAMADAAQALVGRHDWSSFCSASEPPEARVRAMRSADVARRERFVELELVAEGFLRGLARGIAGALGEVGLGRRPRPWIDELLSARDRSQAPRTAPARGLTLMEVIY